VPETNYAENGGVHLAFQTLGDGPPDILLINTWVQHVELSWDIPELDRFLRRLATLGRLIVFDRRGTGLSDSVSMTDLPDSEAQVGDALAVLDAVGSERAVVFGLTEGGQIACLLAATAPARCQALVLAATVARETSAPDYPWGAAEEVLLGLVSTAAETWLSGQNQMNVMLVPSRADDAKTLDSLTRYGRSAVRPGAVAHYFRQSVLADVRHVLPDISVPTLVIGIAEDVFAPAGAVRYMADQIPDARYVELPGADHIVYFAHADAIVEEIEEFLTGSRAGDDPDRVVTTLLFTDIVGSTVRAAALGDRQWRQLLDTHDGAVRRQLQRFGGREVNTAGDGFFATFDGPAKAIRCAYALLDAVAGIGLEIRAGIHTGECEVRGDSFGGLAVHIGARVGALAAASEVLVSSTVKDLLAGSDFRFEDRGEHELKGVPGRWRVFVASRP
jgi:class 3 adenylate cyclase